MLSFVMAWAPARSLESNVEGCDDSDFKGHRAKHGIRTAADSKTNVSSRSVALYDEKAKGRVQAAPRVAAAHDRSRDLRAEATRVLRSAS